MRAGSKSTLPSARLRAAAALWLAVAAWLPASAAFAHPIVDEGRQRYRSADFRGALEAFARADTATDLTSEDLALLLETRALVHLAMDNHQEFETDLARLASIDPNHRFDDDLPPEVRQTFARVRSRSAGRLAVTVDAQSRPDGVVLEASARNDPGALVREVRVYGRAGGGAWEHESDRPLVLPVDRGARVEYYAVAIGPGGATLAEMGSAERPLRSIAGIEDTGAAPAPQPTEDDDSGGGVATWLWIGAGVLVVAATVVLVVVLTSGESDVTQPSAPMPDWTSTP